MRVFGGHTLCVPGGPGLSRCGSFSKLSGVRIVRIAVSPDYQRMKYGSKALDLLLKYYNGKIMFEDEDAEEGGAFEGDDDAEEFSEGKEV